MKISYFVLSFVHLICLTDDDVSTEGHLTMVVAFSINGYTKIYFCNTYQNYSSVMLFGERKFCENRERKK